MKTVPLRLAWTNTLRHLLPLHHSAPRRLRESAFPICLSATHVAHGSIRMEPVFMTLNQSAAIAAGAALDQNTGVQDLPYSELRQRLLAAKQILQP